MSGMRRAAASYLDQLASRCAIKQRLQNGQRLVEMRVRRIIKERTMDQGGGAWPSNAPRRAYATLVCLLAGVLLLVPGLSHASREAWSKTLKKAQHNPAQLIRDAGQALLNSEKIGDKQGELLALQRLSAGNRFLFHAAALKKNAERGIALARELGESEALCWFLHNKALSMLYDRRPDETDALLAEANKLFNEAIAVAEARNLAACVPWIHVSQGMALTRFRKSADALESISKAYALFEALRDDFGMASALTGMASIRREHKEGLIYLERALDLTDPNIYQILAAENYLIRGHWYYARRDMPRARQFYDRAATTARAVQYSTQLGLAESSFAKIAKYEQRFADALVHVDRALLLVKSHPDMGHYINSLLLRADVLMRLGKQQEALHSLSDADTKLKTIDDPLSESMFHELAAAMH
ncbi:MAG: hypothetical protein ACREX0_17000, partial [Noviherbaspirillum sp.]